MGCDGKDSEERDIRENRGLAALCYVGPLVFVALFSAKESRFVRYHANQGLAVFAASAIYYIATSVLMPAVFWRFYYYAALLRFMGLAFPALMAAGIANALNGRMKELPLVGRVKLLK